VGAKIASESSDFGTGKERMSEEKRKASVFIAVL